MPEAGRFFISLGLNGAEKTLSGLSQVNDHFGGLKTISTEAKLAILAALAGLEQLVSVGGKFGSQMTMLHEHLNVSIQDLQKYGNAAQIAGSSTQDMFTAFGNIQNTLEAVRLEGKAAPFMPTLLALMQQSGQNLNFDDIQKMATQKGGDVKFFNMLRGMINNTKVNPADLFYMISQNGMLPTSVYDAVKMGGGKTFDKALGMAPTVSNDNVSKLNNLNMTWQQTLERFETAMMNFTASPQIVKLVNGLDDFADATNKLVLLFNNPFDEKNRESASKSLKLVAADLWKNAPPGSGIGNIRMANNFVIYASEATAKLGQKAAKALQNSGFKTSSGAAAYSSTVTGQ